MSFLFACALAVAVDGDTLRCRDQGRVRLIGIDAPELPGHCRRGRTCTPGNAVASRAALSRAVARGGVTCLAAARDAYGRLLARCAVGGHDLACSQLAGGYAVVRYGDPRCSTM